MPELLALVGLVLFGGQPLPAADAASEAVQKAIAAGEQTVELPAGTHVLSHAIVIPETVNRLEINGAEGGTTLRLPDDFADKAAIVVQGARRVTLARFTIDGNRAHLARPLGLPPSDVAFFDFYSANGIAADKARELTLKAITFREIASFAVLAARSQKVDIENVNVENSGSRNAKGRNNTTGGILLEEGAYGFRVISCTFRNISGNGVWTHSNYGSQRNADGRVARNHFEDIGRDAIQVGHATRIVVTGNTGVRIGYPFDAVDIDGGGIPVAIDTAGNVDDTVYSGNRFEELNGKCIDLDGFHHGEILSNSCVNHGGPTDYPSGHYGIVFNNSNPDMQAREVRISGNVIYGAKFGGLFLIGQDNIVTGNQFLRVNQAGCPATHAQFGCLYKADEPDLLSAGIYLGKGAARPDPAKNNLIRENVITGLGMAQRCLVTAPGVNLKDNTVEDNDCMDEKPVADGSKP